MDGLNEKIVRFDLYCKKCKWIETDEADPESPCFECLENPVQPGSLKPINFKEDD